MNENAITVVIPTIPPRAPLLARALRSVTEQLRQPSEIIVVFDHDREGAAATRQRGLRRVKTPWVAFLDDDDEMMPIHLDHLLRHAIDTEADFVYSWFETIPHGRDPFPPSHFTQPFNPADPIETTITTLVRTPLAQAVGFKPHQEANVDWPGEDRRFTIGCLELGANIQHLVEKTWYWHHDSMNTSGLPTRW